MRRQSQSKRQCDDCDRDACQKIATPGARHPLRSRHVWKESFANCHMLVPAARKFAWINRRLVTRVLISWSPPACGQRGVRPRECINEELASCSEHHFD